MKTLIIPCAGKSSRFPNMRPKWMLTHPDGRLMLDKAIDNIDKDSFDRIIVTIVKEHDEKYESSLILKQVFNNNPKIEICILDSFTRSQSETVYNTLVAINVKGAFVVKDSDNQITAKLPDETKNFIVGYDIDIHRDVSSIPAKSFIIANEQNIILDIVEKKVVSNIICLGIYGFSDAEVFKNAYLEMTTLYSQKEMFLSHVISRLISQKDTVFELVYAENYEDWGTLAEWQATQEKFRTYFVDVDGVLMKNCGQYGSFNWDNNDIVLEDNVACLKKLQDDGGMIIITTSRPEKYRVSLEAMLAEHGIKPYAIIMGINHARRVLINDFAPTNPYPSAVAINMPRNGDLPDYIK